MTASSKRALDQIEQLLVDQTKKLDGFSHRELTELAHQLRSRRERIQRMIRQRTRAARGSGKGHPDTGAHEKKSVLVEAIDRVNAVLEERAQTRDGPSGAGAPKPAAKPKTAAAPKAKAEPKEAKKAPEPKPAAKAADKTSKAKADKDKPAKK